MTARRLDERTGPCKGCPCVDLHCFRDKPSCSLCSSELVSNLITRLEEPHLTTSGRSSTHWITPYREQERVAGQNIERRRRQDIPVGYFVQQILPQRMASWASRFPSGHPAQAQMHRISWTSLMVFRSFLGSDSLERWVYKGSGEILVGPTY